MHGPDQILAVIVAILFVVGIVLMIQRARHKSRVREQWHDSRSGK